MKALTIKLTSDAYSDGECYIANAELYISGKSLQNDDYPLNSVKVYFDVINPEAENADECCDWSNPDGAKLNGEWIADKFEGVNEYKGYIVKYLNTDCSQL